MTSVTTTAGNRNTKHRDNRGDCRKKGVVPFSVYGPFLMVPFPILFPLTTLQPSSADRDFRVRHSNVE